MADLGRRDLLLGAAAASMGCAAQPAGPRTPQGRPTTILLRSSWQTENIGDIAHTPGLLALIDQHLPGTNVILWPEAVDHGVAEMLHANFSRLQIIHGTLDAEGKPLDATLSQAFAEADLMIHGSGSGLPGFHQVQAWKKATRKPFGFFGISLWDITKGMQQLLEGADFVLCRDSLSVANVRKALPNASGVAFAPDAAFGMRARDDVRAAKFLSDHKLKSKNFLCVVPRLRQTPYEDIRRTEWSEAQLQARLDENDRFIEADHEKLRVVIETWVRETGQQVLLCPEMTYQLRLLRPWLYDRLPADVQKSVVVRRTFWFPDEAASTYAHASAVVSVEMHSPILALMAGTPAFYIRQPSDTVKGQMWRDIGLAPWTFEIDSVNAQSLAEAVVQAGTRLTESQRLVAAATAFVKEQQQQAMSHVARGLRERRGL
ncbi:MAG: polysaccharide pyruvyl transferase family protein [Deltaproteobacteria bacterium]|nr:polysaccharide pyruvyl transferase family protein [Deltaproteobacteria bacterium]